LSSVPEPLGAALLAEPDAGASDELALLALAASAGLWSKAPSSKSGCAQTWPAALQPWTSKQLAPLPRLLQSLGASHAFVHTPQTQLNSGPHALSVVQKESQLVRVSVPVVAPVQATNHPHTSKLGSRSSH